MKATGALKFVMIDKTLPYAYLGARRETRRTFRVKKYYWIFSIQVFYAKL